MHHLIQKILTFHLLTNCTDAKFSFFNSLWHVGRKKISILLSASVFFFIIIFTSMYPLCFMNDNAAWDAPTSLFKFICLFIFVSCAICNACRNTSSLSRAFLPYHLHFQSSHYLSIMLGLFCEWMTYKLVTKHDSYALADESLNKSMGLFLPSNHYS